MVEHIREVFIESINNNNFKLITEKLSLEERKYLVEHAEDIFAYEEDKEVVDKLEDNFDSFISNLFTSDERTNLIENIETCSEMMQELLIDDMPPNKALEYLDKVSEYARGKIVSKLPPEEATKYFDKIGEYARGEIVSKLSPEEATKYFDKINEYARGKIVSKLPPEEAIKYLDKIDEYTREEIVKKLPPEEAVKHLDLVPHLSLPVKAEMISKLKEPIDRIKLLSKEFSDLTKEYILTGINVVEVLKTYEEKIKYFDNLPLKSKYDVALNFKEPINKIKYMDEEFTEEQKTDILAGIDVVEVLKTDEEKIKYLDKLPENYRASIISSFSKPITKIEYLDRVSNIESKKFILNSINEPITEILKTDEEKIKYLDGFPENYRVSIINSFSKPTTKIEYLDKISDEIGKNTVLDSIENLMTEVLNTKEERMKYFPLLTNKYKTEVILDFKDEEKIKYLKEVSDYFKVQIISSIKGFDKFSPSVVSFAAEKYPDATIDEYAKVLPLMEKLVNSNSLELSSFAGQFCDLIVQSENSDAVFEKIENVFLRNNIPTFGKIFLSFQTIYPEFDKNGIFDFSEYSRISPQLLNLTQSKEMEAISKFTNGRVASPKDIRFQILFNDLLRITSGSNNRSLLEYLNNIEIGNKLFLGLQQGIIKFNNLDNEAKDILEVFSNHLQALYENMSNADADKLAQVFAQLSTQEKIAYLSEKFSPNGKYDLPDRIVRNFCYQAGIKNFEQLRNIVTNSIREKEQINRTRAKSLEEGQTVKLRKGDFVRTIGEIDALGSSLDNGSVCRELLISFKGTSDSDATPLDIDLSLITEDNKSIYSNIAGTPTSFDYGNIYIILQGDNPNIDITRDEKGNLTPNLKYDPSKIEMFRTCHENHWGARTGIASSDIDYILYKRYGRASILPNTPYDEKGNIKYEKDENKDDIHELSLLKMEIVKNGFYIPVIDFSGKIIFTPEEFDKLKCKMDGLSHYEIKSQWDPKKVGPSAYHMAEHSSNALTDEIKKSLSISKVQTDRQSEIIATHLANIIGSLDAPSGEKMKYKSGISGELTSGTIEVISTGSTSRNTNVPGDYDFDYIFRIDTEIYKNPAKIKKLYDQMLSSFGIEESRRSQYILNGDIREAPLTLPDGRTVPLDITFVRKTDKVKYSTDMALKDRMTNISRNSSVADEVKANIILAKMLLKSAGCYKPNRRDSSQGGLGGVGIENWILQNGGSLESAAESFLEAAKEAKQISAGDNGKEYLEFLRRYQVYDFGANHLAEKKQQGKTNEARNALHYYPYDEFVCTNMNPVGYQKMSHVLEQYLKFIRGDKQVLEQPEFQNVLSKINQLKQFREETQKMLEQYQENLTSQSDKGSRGSRGQVTFLLLMAISFILSMITIIVGIVSYK